MTKAARARGSGRRPGNIANAEVVAFAMYDLGGTGEYVDVEDLFMRCFELAPKRFAWRTRAFPNYKTLYQALVDLERGHGAFLMSTEDGLGRQLSAAGVLWVRDRLDLFRSALNQPSEGMSVRRPGMRLLNELSAAPVVRRFLAGERLELSRYEAADLLIASPDSPPSVWRERMATYMSAAEAAGRPEIQEFLMSLQQDHREWFEGDKP